MAVVDLTAGGRCNLRTRRQWGGGVLLKEQEHKISIVFRLSDGGKRKYGVHRKVIVEVSNILKSKKCDKQEIQSVR
jgi:hypothetical protein